MGRFSQILAINVFFSSSFFKGRMHRTIIVLHVCIFIVLLYSVKYH